MLLRESDYLIKARYIYDENKQHIVLFLRGHLKDFVPKASTDVEGCCFFFF